MIKKILPKTIRMRMMMITAVITFMITVITISICFLVFQSFLMKNQVQTAEFSLQLVANNVYNDMKDALYFSNWCCTNREVIRYLEAFKGKDKLPLASQDDERLRPLALSTYNRVKEEYYNTRPYEFLPRVIISTLNRNNFIQLYFSGDSIGDTAAGTAANAPFFNPLFEASDFRWIGIVDDPFITGVTPDQILPIVRPVYDEFNRELIGWTYVSISSRIFTDYLSGYPLSSDSSLFLTIGDETYSIEGRRFTRTDPLFEKKKVLDNITLDPGTKAYTVTLKDGGQRTLIEHSLGIDDWSISQILSVQQFNEQKQVYYLLILGICAVILSLGALSTVMLNRVISRPVEKLRCRIDGISQGDFSNDPSIEWEHELGTIGKGINRLSENVVSLMDKRVADEKQKKDLEYQILQNQINPHFLYNTLNSIKWMATIQNAQGIAEMTTALARLMKNVSKGASSLITLREELDLVKDYFLIQQYRYGGSIRIEYHIQSEELSDCRIHRFTLQPIIENALFHGIEPKGTAGVITVSAEVLNRPAGSGSISPAKDLVIQVTDNGIGMSEETIYRVLHENNQNSNDFFKQVGISNVNHRIQYDFGPDYGITIQSEEGLYTTMTIRIPYINTRNGDDKDYDQAIDRR